MSTLPERIAAAKRVPKRAAVYVWLDSLDPADREAVMEIVVDTDWHHAEVLRLVNKEGVRASKETISEWRRSLGFAG